jgi:hypothetical protein
VLYLVSWRLLVRAACGEYDFKKAQACQLAMANVDWNDHKEWLKHLKSLIAIGLKK